MDLEKLTRRSRQWLFRFAPNSKKLALRFHSMMLKGATSDNKFRWRGIEMQTYSQARQDVFVQVVVPKGMKTYLEIGSSDPKLSSNTLALENLGWKGVSVDIDSIMVSAFRSARKNAIVLADATTLDYRLELREHKMPRNMGYLSIDIEPAAQSLRALEKIPFERYKFAAVTFEHDAYREGNAVRDRSRDILSQAGYVLWLGDVTCFPFQNFEDWWVSPDLIGQSEVANWRKFRFK